MGYVKCWTIALAVLFTASCGAPPQPPPQPPTPPAKTVFDPLTQSLDKAREVQATVDEGAAKTRKAIDDQERGAPTP
ncbi:MAG TPA: hypothetical protein VHS76_02195 [Steroidobacteraceae bacterium]|nr:hypothetical protein [Steroidobacteraceae bacterium]